MGNILIFNSPDLNTWQFAKFVTKINLQLKCNIIVYNQTFSQAAPVFELVTAGDHDEIENHHFSDTGDLADKLNKESPAQVPVINVENVDFCIDEIADTIALNNIKLIIMSKQEGLLVDSSSSDIIKLVSKLTCPVFLIPDAGCQYPDKISYLTDLRYCTLEAVKYLKMFKGSIYVTHMTAPGLTDIEDRYSQELLASFASRLEYKKIFLRNIRGKQKENIMELITREVEINCVAVESKKHSLLACFLSSGTEKSRNYHRVPLLILPYLNWRS